MNLQQKNNKGLVAYCRAQLGRPYWYGCFGQRATETLYDMKRRQYPRMYAASDFPRQYGEKVHDCVGLIKGYMWTADADDTKPVYVSNGMRDVSADMLYNQCKRKSDNFSKMPDIPGIAVFKPGHVGVYIGDGEVVEARGHSYGVVKTRLEARNWKRWAFLPFIQYLVDGKEARL